MPVDLQDRATDKDELTQGIGSIVRLLKPSLLLMGQLRNAVGIELDRLGHDGLPGEQSKNECAAFERTWKANGLALMLICSDDGWWPTCGLA